MKDTPNGKEESDDASGFETLLKPIHDVLAKNWSLSIKNFLESYIEYLHKINIINFSQAALIVQNSCLFYCKRVDIVYTWVRDFTLNLAKSKKKSGDFYEDSHEAGNDGQSERRQASKKLKVKEADLDEFKVMQLAHRKDKHKDRVAFEKIGLKKMQECRLATNTKAPGKQGTSVPVYETEGSEMGYKDEFKLHAIIYFDGELRDGFYRSRAKLVLGQSNLCLRFSEDVINADEIAGDSNALGRSIELNPVPPPAPDTSVADLALDDHFVDVDNVDADEEAIENIDPFKKPISYSSLIIHRQYKNRNVFKYLPENNEENQKKKKRVSLKIVNDECCYHLSISKMLSGRAEDMVSLKLRARKKECLKILLKKRKTPQSKNKNVPDLNNPEDDDHLDDFDDTLGDLRDVGVRNSFPSLIREENSDKLDEAYEKSCRLMHLHKIKEDGLTVQMRVAAWHDMIRPTLELAEKRSQFDAHEYGTAILEGFKTVGETRSFFDIASGNEVNEISRYFLSSLMLANTYNVELSTSNPGELSKDCLELKLLSMVRHHEELDANVGAAAAATV